VKLDQSLSFRKAIIPWYDVDAACYITLGFLLPVLLFSFVGISVAQSQPSPSTFLWIPLLLAGLSGLVLVSVSARLIRRRFGRENR
jgi:hypothetical protein